MKMIRITLIVLAAWIISNAVMTAQGAEPTCARVNDTHGVLAEFGLAPVLRGVSIDGDLMEIWTTVSKTHWTMTSTSPTGIACILATGRNVELHEPTKPAEEKAS